MMIAGPNMRRLSLKCRHANRLLRDTVANFGEYCPFLTKKVLAIMVQCQVVGFSVKIIAKPVWKGSFKALDWMDLRWKELFWKPEKSSYLSPVTCITPIQKKYPCPLTGFNPP
jgi:hypothetical protein